MKMIRKYVCPCCGQINETDDSGTVGCPNGGRVIVAEALEKYLDKEST